MYDDRLENEATYWFFARSRHDPYKFYLRRFIDRSAWTPWEQIELTIAAPTVSPVIHQGRLYLFWVSLITSDDAMGLVNRSDADSQEENKSKGQPILLEYTFLTESGKWNETQSVKFYLFRDAANTSLSYLSSKVYPESKNQIRVIHPISLDDAFQQVVGHLDAFHNKLLDNDGEAVDPHTVTQLLAAEQYRTSGLKMRSTAGFFPTHNELVVRPHHILYFNSEASAERSLLTGRTDADQAIMRFPRLPDKNNLRIVHNRLLDNLLYYGDQQFLIYRTDRPGYPNITPKSLFEALLVIANSKRRMVRLTTTVSERLADVLFNSNLDTLLTLDTQRIEEIPLGSSEVEFSWLGELVPHVDGDLLFGKVAHLNFDGAYGAYFRELFFDIPLLIAHYLNASHKFAQGDYWYRKIFDPTSAAREDPEPVNPTDRNWRFIEFRDKKIPKLRQILTDAAALKQYTQDPFNPWAIARLRISAFQKSVVMKYIDNLLDWGDQLFAQDTFESINEATMLYVMAADILGDRPVEVGDCETTTDFLLTYANILSHKVPGSEFLIELENLFVVMAYLNFEPPQDPEDNDNDTSPGQGFLALRRTGHQLTPYTQLKLVTDRGRSVAFDSVRHFQVAAKASAEMGAHRSLAFCVPPNEKLLAYWDRVGDRLFKIRNCMNLRGVRRQLALFQPPIDPGLLVKAKASGLSLEDVLALLSAEIPSYRFAFLIDKAKQFLGTIQSFGNALLNALEKKDTEDLALLRAVHEQVLLKTLREIKAQNIDEAEANRSSLEETQKLARSRKLYYQELLEDAKDTEFGLNEYEVTHLEKIEKGKSKQESAFQADLDASINYKMPTWEAAAQAGGGISFSSPGPVVTAIGSVSFGSSNLAARKTSDANKRRKEALGFEFEANQASVKAGYIRRRAEWLHQKALAEQEEIHQVEQQIAAAQIRIQLAKADLAAHDRQTDQSNELHEFYKDKFTNLGLYTYLTTSLSRLYREAYNLAHDMALKAQGAYQFETDDQTFFIGNDNWEADKAGLLAGERLTLQLQRMERAYLEQNLREHEITLPCSLGQIDPQALLELRATGSCDFSIPEVWFDLYYPGQYKRRIKSVRASVPCVVGPYTNVSAKLTLTGSQIRTEPQLSSALIGVPHQRNTSVATSTGNHDSGVFELNFRDERYLPFEGAGAVSDWRLELPSQLRPFDYSTISDVILHISYTAKDDGRFKSDVESALAERFTELAAGEGLSRSFSLKREFPNQLHQLIFPSQGQDQATELRMSTRYFPYFVKDRQLTVSQVELFLKSKDGETVDSNNLTLEINQKKGSAFSNHQQVGLPFSTFELTEALSRQESIWRLAVTNGSLSADSLEDIYLLVSYHVGGEQ